MVGSKHHFLFRQGRTDTVSRPFNSGVFVVGFNLRGIEYTTTPEGRIDSLENCDTVMFERLLYDDIYDIDKCNMDILENGVILAEPVRDECGKLITLTRCNNTVYLTDPGIYRAVYKGNGRPEAAVVFYNLE